MPFDAAITANLAHADIRSFDDALRTLQQAWPHIGPADALTALIDALNAINATELLDASERSRRVQIIVQSLALTDDVRDRLAQAAGPWKAEVKTAVAAVLPPNLRRLIYGRGSAASPAIGATPSSVPTLRTAEPDAAALPSSVAGAVLLLGSFADHDANLATLRAEGFTPYRVDRADALPNHLDAGVCGCVISRSFWASLPADQHRHVIERIVGHSNFTWIQLDEDGFVCPVTLQQICRDFRLTSDPFIGVGTSRVTPFHLEQFRSAREILSTGQTASLYPADIGAAEAHLLLAATAHCVRLRHLTARVELQKVPVAPMPGGRSTARLYRIEPDDGGLPFIGKVDDPQLLREEMGRFRAYIQAWDGPLDPCMQYHAGTGVIVFAVIDAPDTPGRPAPTLEQCLEDCLYGEFAGPQTDVESNLRTAIERAVQKLTLLNRQSPATTHPTRQWLTLDSLQSLAANGIVFSILGLSGGGDALALVNLALDRASRFLVSATVHGDIHLRNILLRDGRDPFFIDYACSGPGHPCFDLARLESALMFQCFRMTGGESEIGQLVAAIAEGAVEDDIRARFPALCSSIGNRLAIHASILCRSAAINLLRPHSGTLLDYLAVRYIVACQSLGMVHLQSGIVRGTIRGIAHTIEHA